MNEAEAKPEEGLDLLALASQLEREYQAADNYAQLLDQHGRQAFAYYEAQPFGNEIEGRSQIVLPDVQETVDYMQQSVLRTFVSGDNTVEFEATDEADAQAADDATSGINYIFMRQQDGFRILHDGLYDGLLRKLGVFKTVMETVEKVTRETLQFGSEEELALVAEQMGLDVEATQPGADGSLAATIKRESSEKRFIDYAVPLNEFRFSPNARHEDEADYLCHVSPKTRSDLVEMGFDVDQVYALPTHADYASWTQRVESNQLDSYHNEESSPALEKVLLCEEYARIDLDDDGIAERVKVFRVGSEILNDAESGEPSIETVEDQPFAVFCPFPRPHRMVGYSLADKVMHIQYQRSFVGRQLFDGMALTNMPRPIVDSQRADADTYGDILNPVPGSPIRAPGGMATVGYAASGFDPQKSLAVMEWITGERESLTGITRLNQGLDADTLNKTATGTALMQAQGQQNEEAIARQFAETIGRLFSKKYRLMKAEGEPFKVKVDGQYRVVDPSTWPDDVNLIIRVGLGSNSKDKRIQYRMAMAPMLSESIMAGLSGPQHAFKMWDGLARDMGIGQGDDFAYDPDNADQQPQQDKPDPAMAKVQGEQQLAAAKLQGDQQAAQAKLEADQQAQAFKLQAMAEEQAHKQQLARDQADFEAQLAQAKAQRESDLAEQRMAFEASIAERQMQLAEQAHAHKLSMAEDAALSKNRPGGSLAE